MRDIRYAGRCRLWDILIQQVCDVASDIKYKCLCGTFLNIVVLLSFIHQVLFFLRVKREIARFKIELMIVQTRTRIDASETWVPTTGGGGGAMS